MGACRTQELHSMTVEDLQDLGSAFLVTIPKTKTKVVRKFTITDKYYQICKKYADLRPKNLELKSFFINYQKGRCTTQKIGINKLGAMGKEIAKFLKLSNPNLYTGHCFRRSSATLLVDGGGDLTCLKRHGGWKSTSVAEGYIDDSLQNKMATAKKILNSMEQNSTKTTTYTENQLTSRNITTTVDLDSKASINFQNCSNFTVNFVTNK